MRVGSRDGSKGGGTFAEVAAHGELLLNCTAGTASLAALEQAGEANLRGNVLVDVANPLDFSAGFPPRLFIAGDDASAKEQVVELLESIGWSRTRVLDLGGVAASRGMEMYLPLWLSLFAKQGSPLLNVQILHGAPSG